MNNQLISSEGINCAENFKLDRENSNVILNYINKYYSNFEEMYPIKVVNEKQFDTPVNFKQAKTKAIK